MARYTYEPNPGRRPRVAGSPDPCAPRVISPTKQVVSSSDPGRRISARRMTVMAQDTHVREGLLARAQEHAGEMRPGDSSTVVFEATLALIAAAKEVRFKHTQPHAAVEAPLMLRFTRRKLGLGDLPATTPRPNIGTKSLLEEVTTEQYTFPEGATLWLMQNAGRLLMIGEVERPAEEATPSQKRLLLVTTSFGELSVSDFVLKTARYMPESASALGPYVGGEDPMLSLRENS